MELQAEHHFWIVTLSSMLRVAYWIVGQMRKEGFIAGTLIIVGRILDWGILHAVALRVAKRLCMSSSNW